MRFVGLVRNQSTDPNSIARIHLVVWADTKKRSTKTFGYIPNEIVENGSQITLPISFDPRQGRQLDLTYELVLTGSHEMALATAQEPLPASTPGLAPGQVLTLPKYAYELAFEDTLGNLFDQEGLPRNRKEIDLRWTLGNFRGRPRLYVQQLFKIGSSRAAFFVRRTVRRVGL